MLDLSEPNILLLLAEAASSCHNPDEKCSFPCFNVQNCWEGGEIGATRPVPGACCKPFSVISDSYECQGAESDGRIAHSEARFWKKSSF